MATESPRTRRKRPSYLREHPSLCLKCVGRTRSGRHYQADCTCHHVEEYTLAKWALYIGLLLMAVASILGLLIGGWIALVPEPEIIPEPRWLEIPSFNRMTVLLMLARELSTIALLASYLL